jgi:Ca2+-binding RTX toxin-like protein
MSAQRLRRIAFLAVALAAASVAAAFAFAPVGPPGGVRVSMTGSDGDAGRNAEQPAVAYNSKRGEYMVVWEADGLATDNEVEVFGRRLTRAGTPIGTQFRISTTGADGDPLRDAEDPAVAYNPRLNQYLVVWEADALAAAGEFEIFGQRLGATGAELGGDFRISTTGADGDTGREAFGPAVAYNSRRGEYLVAWSADALAAAGEFEIFGQRLAGGGADLGGDFRISTTGADGDAARDAFRPAVAFNSRLNQFFVVWTADGVVTDNEVEIFGRRLAATGAKLGGDFRISTTGPDADADRGAFRPAVAYNSRLNQHLVVWYADSLATDEKYEIFGQRLGATGSKLGGDLRISITGPEGDADRGAFVPVAAYSSRANEYFVAWYADGLATDGEFEIFGQRVASGGRRLDGTVRISRTGADGDAERDALDPAIAFGADQHLVAWEADGLATDNGFEIFARRVRSPRCAGKPATRIGTKGRDVIRGTRRRDVIVGLAGNDRLLGRAGNDLICGGKGSDRVAGGTGRDRLAGGKGRDRLIGGPGRDWLWGGPGRDRVKQ